MVLPVLPVKNTVLFPSLFIPLAVGRPGSMAAVEAAAGVEEKSLIIVAQRDASVEQPTPADLYPVGTRAVIRKLVRSENRMELLVHGAERVSIEGYEQTDPYLKAKVRMLPFPQDEGTELEALHGEVVALAQKVLELVQPQAQQNLAVLMARERDPLSLAYLIGSLLSIDVAQEQALLAAATRVEALRLVHEYLSHEQQVLELRHKIASQTQTEINKQQREYMLRQQLRTIQEELGEENPEQAEIAALRGRIGESEMPEEVRKEAERELKRLERLPPAAPDHQVIRTYLELVLELPWGKSTTDNLDLAQARQVLDEDHYDLDEVKERILEHLAVMKLNPQAHSPILCFVGPPGVGKTSLGQSIARALGRKFERMSLGGMHDEAELRGHRRTYVGAMPGRIIQAIRRAGVRNPVLMLDEVDKLGRDFRGDPAAALLEILDPAQNATFRDNYLDLPFDLSRVFFITTANVLDTIPQPLLDRMELLRLPGYSQEEKAEIARRYLIPRQISENGLKSEQLEIPDPTLAKLIANYTREAGVRQLERGLGRLSRKVARRFAEGRTEKVVIGSDELAEMLGPERFLPERARQKLPIGVATGLAWTEAGGEVLYVETTLLPSGRGLTLTGSLGEVMRESVRAAQSYIWAHGEELGIDRKLFRNAGVHVHVPAGAVPKDGPSAGVAMVTALASLYADLPAASGLAMTGEITLSGLVMPVGGIKEKVLAAHRAGLQRVLLPKANAKDLRELPEHVRGAIEFVFAETISEVLDATLVGVRKRLKAVSGT
ncbi:MAG TPA: endopeptidase La [Acidobacteriota bacterium]